MSSSRSLQHWEANEQASNPGRADCLQISQAKTSQCMKEAHTYSLPGELQLGSRFSTRYINML